MRRVLAVIVIVVAFALASLPPVSAHGKVDQMNDSCESGPTGAWSIVTLSQIGQSFLPKKKNLLGVDLFLRDLSENPLDTVLQVTIHEDTMDGNVVGLTTSVLSGGFGGFPGGWLHFDFAGKVKLKHDRTYVIEVIQLTPPTSLPNSHNVLVVGSTPADPDLDPYPEGTKILSSVEAPPGDLCFKTHTNGK